MCKMCCFQFWSAIVSYWQMPCPIKWHQHSGLLNISGVCPEISSICPEIRIGDKDGAIFLSYDTKISRLLKVSYVFGNLRRVFKNFQISTNFGRSSGNFQHVSGNFDNTKRLYLFSIIWPKIIPDCSKFPPCVGKFLASVRKFPDY